MCLRTCRVSISASTVLNINRGKKRRKLSRHKPVLKLFKTGIPLSTVSTLHVECADVHVLYIKCISGLLEHVVSDFSGLMQPCWLSKEIFAVN